MLVDEGFCYTQENLTEQALVCGNDSNDNATLPDQADRGLLFVPESVAPVIVILLSFLVSFFHV